MGMGGGIAATFGQADHFTVGPTAGREHPLLDRPPVTLLAGLERTDQQLQAKGFMQREIRVTFFRW
ncbi:hypothetical protein D3C80_1595020 [compost metagenome]